ncbi:phage terminase small subunit P27 family [Rhodococcus qingshengii]|uniref:phage terminase small subunit P27 family n=1 Tax=Rhodococcus qingshengii TaxID=334542 RepID=UPI000C9FE43A|nr:phage terminase small subunit P27 family [Rhodococcus qingshengii]AUS34613.1 phage terminase small subunit P27 family [Rhodococcus qingshengii]
MAKRGPKSRPNHLKIAEGVREDRVNRDEPIPAETPEVRSGILEPPIDLSENAREVWDRLVPDLVAQKVMTAWDIDQFAMFCVSVATYWDALDAMGSSMVTEGASGSPIKSPYWQIMRDAEAAASRIGARFGLSPSDRASLKVGGDESDKKAGAERLLG